jgi:hypothetical protein
MAELDELSDDAGCWGMGLRYMVVALVIEKWGVSHR